MLDTQLDSVYQLLFTGSSFECGFQHNTSPNLTIVIMINTVTLMMLLFVNVSSWYVASGVQLMALCKMVVVYRGVSLPLLAITKHLGLPPYPPVV